jgi:hypothetical protein
MKLELRPELLASFARRLLISGFKRTLSVALRVFAIDTFYHIDLGGSVAIPVGKVKTAG